MTVLGRGQGGGAGAAQARRRAHIAEGAVNGLDFLLAGPVVEVLGPPLGDLVAL